MSEVKNAQIRKNNMKLYPIYQMIGFDLMFFYAIQMLFLMQVKHFSASDAVLLGAFYALAAAVLHIPATLIVSKIGKKNSIVLGNVFNLIYILMYIFCDNFIEFIIAEVISATAFAFKGVTENSFLNESIPKVRRKSEIFTRINESGFSKFSYFSAIAMLASGFLYDINPYIPMVCCAICVFASILVAANFIDLNKMAVPEKEKKQENVKQKLESISKIFKEVKSSLSFIFKSKRLRALFLITATIWGLLCLANSYRTAILEDINCSATFIGVLAAFLEFVKGYAATRAHKFNKKNKNKSLTILGLVISIPFILAGLILLINISVEIQLFVIVLSFTFMYQAKGIYQVIKNRYINSFSNSKILPKIYSVDGITMNLARMLIAFVGSMVLANMEIKYATIVVGIIFTVIIVLISKYMKTRIGLKPDEYKKEDITYER